MAGERELPRKRVLVVRIGRLGDTVLATPVIDVLRAVFDGDVSIDFAASPGASSALLDLDRRIDRVFSIGRRRLPWPVNPEKRELRRRSRAVPYDLVVNLECGNECDDFRDFIQASEFIGRPLIRRQHAAGRHCVDTEKSIYADRLGPDITAAANPRLEIPMEEEFDPPFDHDYVVLNPGFSGVLKSGFRRYRGWPVVHWVKLIGLIVERTDLGVVVNGTERERNAFESLLAQPGVRSLFGTSLRALTQTLARARCLVSIDTGTMHLGTALGAPTVALFGPTIPELTGPYSSETPFTVLRSGIECQPCFRTQEERICSRNRCMDEVAPDTVFAAMRGQLAG